MGRFLPIALVSLVFAGCGSDTGTADAPKGPRTGQLGVLTGETIRGFVDGTGRGARFEGINAMELSLDGGTLYVADSFNGTLRAVDTTTGKVTTAAGEAQSFSASDGVGTEARFISPRGLALSPDGATLYVGDATTLRSYDVVSGEVLLLMGLPWEPGHVNGSALEARFGQLQHDMVVTADGATLIMADRLNDSLRSVDLASETVATLSSAFNGPGGMALSDTGVFVADTFSDTIRHLDLANDDLTVVAGSPGASGATDGPLADARLASPQGIARHGEVLYAAGFDGLLRRVDLELEEISTPIGVPGEDFCRDGDAATARLGGAFAPPVVDAARNLLYYGDTSANSVRVVDLVQWTVQTLAGPLEPRGHVDGSLADARFQKIYGVASSDSGQLIYVADPQNGAVRAVDVMADTVTTITSTSWDSPVSLALDESGNRLFVSDAGTSRISVVDLGDESVTMLTDPDFQSLWGIAFDGTELYAADYDGPTVHRVNAETGEVTLLAGSGFVGGNDGIGAGASFRGPLSLAVSKEHGALLVSDYTAHTIRRIDVESGTVTTLVGLDDAPGAIDGGAGQLNGPSGLIAHGDSLLVADTENHLIRRVSLKDGSITTVIGRAGIAASPGHGPGVHVDDATVLAPEALVWGGENLFIAVENAVLTVPLQAVLP